MSTDPKESRQTRVVGPKFDAEGQARRFPGNTVISFLRERSPVEAELSWVLDMLAPLGFSAAFIPLPADSFHMTVFDLLCDQVRSKEHWSKRLPLDMPLGEIDAALSEWLDPLPDSDSIQMRYAGIGPIHTSLHILLDPANNQAAEALESFREQLVDRTGIQHPVHHHYRFHISLAYVLRTLDDDEGREFERFTQVVDQRLSKSLARVELGDPQLAFFETMLAYHSKRTPEPADA